MNKKPSVRKLKEMEKVVWDKKFSKDHPEKELYKVYRNLKTDGKLRYDVTEIKAQMLGEEFNRTKGNCNDQGFQELYTVLEGEAIFYLQRFKKEIVSDVYGIKTQEGEWVIIPPNYWVITINPSRENVLETGNWVSEKTENQYEALEEMGGPCYFYTESGWQKNKNYEEVPELKFKEPLLKRPEALDFLRTGIE